VSDIKVSAGDSRPERNGSEPLPRLPRRGAVVSRHGAISRELTKYSNYKTWADKARGAFAAEAGDAPGVSGAGLSRRSSDR
jgi:hypothetical protein